MDTSLNLKEMMKKSGLSVTSLTQKLNENGYKINISNVSRLVGCDTQNVDVGVLSNLCKVFKCPPSALLKPFQYKHFKGTVDELAFFKENQRVVFPVSRSENKILYLAVSTHFEDIINIDDLLSYMGQHDKSCLANLLHVLKGKTLYCGENPSDALAFYVDKTNLDESRVDLVLDSTQVPNGAGYRMWGLLNSFEKEEGGKVVTHLIPIKMLQELFGKGRADLGDLFLQAIAAMKVISNDYEDYNVEFRFVKVGAKVKYGYFTATPLEVSLGDGGEVIF